MVGGIVSGRPRAGIARYVGGRSADRTGIACAANPMPAPRIGQMGQKYHAPAYRPTASQTESTMTTIAR